MIDRLNELLLSALQRGGKPKDSEELEGEAKELALDNLWTPAHVAPLTRKSVAKRCADMVASRLMVQEGKGFDSKASRSTPKFAPAAGYDANAWVPPPPITRERAVPDTSQPTQAQVNAVLDAQGELLEELTRQNVRRMQDEIQNNQTISGLREKLRARLMATGMSA